MLVLVDKRLKDRMLTITFTSGHFDRRARRWVPEAVAVFEMDGEQLRLVDGDASRLHLDGIRLVAADGRDLVSTDGEEWGRLLPQAFGSSPFDVEVESVAAGAGLNENGSDTARRRSGSLRV